MRRYCGTDNWVEIKELGKAKREWFERFLKLPNGVPSHDTFGRVFGMLGPDRFAAGLTPWVNAVSELGQGEVVAIHGKTLRGCHGRSNGGVALDLVSAWAAENRMVLGQTRTAAHSNEITAIPELLQLLELPGCRITIDTMGCQRSIARKILDDGADCLLAVPANQGELHANIKDVFACWEREGFDQVGHTSPEEVDYDHGRRERRGCWAITDPKELAYVDPAGQWAGLRSVARISYSRECHKEADVGAPEDTRYYICCYPAEAAALLRATRDPWGIENRLHWALDIALDEDRCQVRSGNADQNLAVVRCLALNLLKQELTAKVGIKAKRKRAGWDYDYLLKVLSQ